MPLAPSQTGADGLNRWIQTDSTDGYRRIGTDSKYGSAEGIQFGRIYYIVVQASQISKTGTDELNRWIQTD